MRLTLGLIGFLVASAGSSAWASTTKVAEAKGEKAYLGIHLGGVEGAEDEAEAGIRVLQILEGSPAEAAGLLKEDIVTRVGQRSVDSVEHFVYLMSTHAPGDTVNFTVLREGETIQVPVELGTWPADGPAAPKPGMPKGHMFHKSFGWQGDFDEHLGEIIGEAAGKDVNVDLDCKNGEGTIRIEIDGQVQEHPFPCGPGMKKQMWMLHGGPEDSAMDLDLDLDIPGVTQGGLKILRGFAGEPRTTFEANDDGSITVTVRKGENQLVKRYGGVDALPDNLRSQFEELNNGLE